MNKDYCIYSIKPDKNKDYYLGNENKYPKDIRDFLKKYNFSIIPY